METKTKKPKSEKPKKARHEWVNYATEVMGDWLTGRGHFKEFPDGPKVWENMLSQMLASDQNWLYTFDQAFERFQDLVMAEWRKEMIETGDPLQALCERLVCASTMNIDTLNLAVGLLKHSGHWHTYLRLMQRTAEEIEGYSDAAYWATPCERNAMERYVKETTSSDCDEVLNARRRFISEHKFSSPEVKAAAEWFMKSPGLCEELVAKEMEYPVARLGDEVDAILLRDAEIEGVDGCEVGRAIYMAYGIWHSYWVNWVDMDGDGNEPEGTPEELAAMEILAAISAAQSPV